MSKSKGNVVLPTAILDEFGSDAVRYWSASARLGVDTAFDQNVLREGRRLVLKILNASRLVKGYKGEGGPPTHPMDRALIARLRAVVEEATARWDAWEHAAALAATESWFWSDFTDNYLELSKERAYAGDASALGTLRLALDVALRLFAPIIVYATEDVWNSDGDAPSSIHKAPWPDASRLEGEDDGCFDAAVAVLTQIRKAKSDASVSIKFPVARLEVRASSSDLGILERVLEDVLVTGSVEKHELVADETVEGFVVSVTLGDAPSQSPS
jgi:valyl-tRNA synthetase